MGKTEKDTIGSFWPAHTNAYVCMVTCTDACSLPHKHVHIPHTQREGEKGKAEGKGGKEREGEIMNDNYE